MGAQPTIADRCVMDKSRRALIGVDGGNGTATLVELP
jgi:hypothetical protein